MKTYQLQLINCNNHNIEISRYLQILTRIEKEDADRIVSNVPVVLYEIWTRNVRDILKKHWIIIRLNMKSSRCRKNATFQSSHQDR